MTDAPINESDLLAYVDGLLDADRRRAVEAWLAQHPAAARRVAVDLALNDGLMQLFGRPRRGVGLPQALGRLAAAVALVAGGAAGGWALADRETIPALPIEQLADRPVTSIGDIEPVDALGESLRRAVRVPDLSSAGLRLVGQAVIGGSDRPTLRLIYEDHSGERVLLLVQARDDLRVAAHHRQGQQRGLLSWAEGPLAFALAGDLSGDELRILAELVHSAPSRLPRRSGPVLPVADGAVR